MTPFDLSFDPIPLLAETVRSDVRWHAMPAAWVVVMVIIPLLLLIGWWGYRGEKDLPPRVRYLLGGLRAGALFFFLLLLFGPYAELSEMRVVRSHLLVMVDTSDSMSTKDGYEPDDGQALSRASGVPEGQLQSLSRLELAQRVLTNERTGLLEKYTGDFRLHAFQFGSHLTPLISTGESADEDEPGEAPPAVQVRDRLLELRAREPSTRLGQAVATALDTFRLRDEPVAGIIVISDGQNNAGAPSPLQAGRRAESQNVPIYAVGVGDPRSPRNIHVSNLRAKEVVLAKDTALFEFTVRAKGFEGRPVRIEMQRLDDDGKPTGSQLSLRPDQVVLAGEDEQQVKVSHTFRGPGTYTLRIGVPPQPEEKIESDNWVTHTMRVIDRKIKVLYVEGSARWEYGYLANALTRDRDTMLVHTLLLNADPDAPQKATRTAGWHSLDVRGGLPDREGLFEYDVIIIGDVDWRDFGPSHAVASKVVENLHEFVEKGGGLAMLSGLRHNPTRYLDTDLAAVLPIVVDRATETMDPPIDPSRGFGFRVTPEGERSPLMNVAGNPENSKRLWETRPEWRQYWAYPALRAKTISRVLAVSDHHAHENKFGSRPLIATMLYGRGRVLYLGVDELWRLRIEAADKYFYRFYGEAVRWLATYKLLSGNKRFKIITDRDRYPLDDSVRITLDVLDTDYNPSAEDAHTVKLDMPGDEPGTRDAVDLVIEAADPRGEPGVYRKTIVPTRPGQYRLSAAASTAGEEPAEKLFQVVQSSLEGRDLLLDEVTLRALADESAGGQYLNLWDLPDLDPPSRSKPIPTDVRPDEMWDNGWALALALLLLGSEWLLRKRWQLV